MTETKPEAETMTESEKTKERMRVLHRCSVESHVEEMKELLKARGEVDYDDEEEEEEEEDASESDGPSDDDEEEKKYPEDLEESIRESPLSLQVRSDWHSPGDEPDGGGEYELLMGTGGPAVRIVGEFDEHGEQA